MMVATWATAAAADVTVDVDIEGGIGVMPRG